MLVSDIKKKLSPVCDYRFLLQIILSVAFLGLLVCLLQSLALLLEDFICACLLV